MFAKAFRVKTHNAIKGSDRYGYYPSGFVFSLTNIYILVVSKCRCRLVVLIVVYHGVTVSSLPECRTHLTHPHMLVTLSVHRQWQFPPSCRQYYFHTLLSLCYIYIYIYIYIHTQSLKFSWPNVSPLQYLGMSILNTWYSNWFENKWIKLCRVSQWF